MRVRRGGTLEEILPGVSMHSPFRRPFSRLHAALLLAPAIALTMYACDADHSETTAPMLLGARSAANKVSLTVNAAGSTAGGTITSSRGGISCTFTVSGTAVSKSGKCAQDYKTGATDQFFESRGIEPAGPQALQYS